jgi:hypothetical protein
MKKFGFGDYSFYEDFDGCELTQEIIDQYCIRKQNDPDGTEKKLAVYYPIIDVDGQRKRELNILNILDSELNKLGYDPSVLNYINNYER